MKEIAHAAIEAGADIVAGHGPHYALPIEVYHGRPIFYGLGSFSFHTGHGGRQHEDWVGMMARIAASRHGIEGATIAFVRHNDRNETFLCALKDEAEACAALIKASAPFGTALSAEGDEIRVALRT
jgi:poly-gamma-glutamate synthesis protein (capsule biosynthesis protein)